MLSPALFNLYINDLKVEMNKFSHTLGFADDIASIVIGEIQLKKVIDTVSKWSKNYKIDVNKKKSAILIIR